MAEWDDEILTGEGVAIDSGAAPMTLRMVSGIIDVLVYGIALWGFWLIIGDVWLTLNEALRAIIAITMLVLFLIIFPATVETLTRGRSVGRIAIGTRIVRDDGGPISFRHAFGRAMVGLVEIFATLGMVAVTVSLLSQRGKRVGDFLSGTYAMRTRGRQQAMPPLWMPPDMQEWAAHADMRRLPDGLALTARMFLSRASSMHMPSRVRLGNQLAAQFREYVGPNPPLHVHPETFIAAVLVARRDREYSFESRQARKSEQESKALRALPYGLVDSEN